MLAQQRRVSIVETLGRSGAMRVIDLAQTFGVSEMTVRRDLKALEESGALSRVHGGAMLHQTADKSPHVDEPNYREKATIARPAKLAIAARAAQLVESGMVVGVSAGTTTWFLATHLARIAPLTVVTNSVTVSERIAELADPLEQSIVLTGGTRTPSAGMVGPIAEQALRSVNIDMLFVGCYGMDAVAGLTSPSFAEGETNRTLVSRSRRVVVIADSTKWQILGVDSWARLDQVDVLITDDGLPAEARDQIAAKVGELIIVQTDD